MKISKEEIEKYNMYYRHYACGGGLYEPSGKNIPFGYGAIGLLRCTKCGKFIDPSDYEEHAGYWAGKQDAEYFRSKMTEIYKIDNQPPNLTAKDNGKLA